MNVFKATNPTMVVANYIAMAAAAAFLIVLPITLLTQPSGLFWQRIGLVGVVWQVFNTVGIAAGAHRYFSHKAFQCNRFWQYVMAYFCMVSLVGPPCIWAEAHRKHHQHADTPDDPYRQWMLDGDKPLSHTTKASVSFMARMIKKDRLHYLTLKYYWLWVASYIALAAGIGLITNGTALGGIVLLWLLPAGLSQLTLRVVLWTGHLPWLGYRNHSTPDTSNNSISVSLISAGEGWHNNHHQHPGSAKTGERWWELDPTWWFIKAIRSKA